MGAKTKILIVEHDQSDIELLQYELNNGGISYISTIVENEPDYHHALTHFKPDIILSDYRLPLFDGPSAFAIKKRLVPDTPFIFVSGTIGEENSIEHIKNGVTDYALKDALFTLPSKVQRALREAKDKKNKDKIDQELVESEKRLARAQQLAHMGSWELNFATNIVLWSDEACRIYGLPSDQSKQTFETWLSFVHPEDLGFVLQKIKESENSLHNFSFYHRIVRQDGIIRHIYSEGKIEFEVNGKPKGFHGVAQDVTTTKLYEIERINLVNDLVQRNKDLEQFAYIVSHNLRAPVANILGATNGLAYPELKTSEKELLIQGLAQSVTNLDDVVKDLNYILEVKLKIIETKSIVLFSALVDTIKLSIKSLIDSNKMDIKYDFSAIDQMLTLKSYVHSIFYNLISNSIKYRQQHMPAFLKIISYQTNNKIELKFIDNGMGIDLEKRGGQIFGLYKRFHTNIEGKGMGLFMVKAQVETLGGKISVKSRVNRGTEFKIEFDK